MARLWRIVMVGMLVLSAAAALPMASAAAPALTVAPPTGPAGAEFLLSGTGFAPNTDYTVYIADAAGQLTARDTITTDARGTLNATYDSTGDALGRYTANIAPLGATDPVLAATPLTITIEAGGPVSPDRTFCPSQTGFCARNAFYDFWRTHGAVEVLGYPIDEARITPTGQIIQFYERAILEWHPENDIAYQVELTRLAALLVADSPEASAPPVPCTPNCASFDETGHTLRDEFLGYWETYGGLAVFGFPLTEQFVALDADNGQPYLVQYFERNRFELHPEVINPRYRVLLGRLGAELLDTIGADIRALPLAEVPNYGEAGSRPLPPITARQTPNATGTNEIFLRGLLLRERIVAAPVGGVAR